MMNVDDRIALKRRTPKIHLSLEHTCDCRVLPNREALLEELPHGGIVAEVGAAFGDFTREIIYRNRPRRLHLIDSWDSPRYQKDMKSIMEEFELSISEGTLIIDQGFSLERLPGYAASYFDWVYIDTDHSYETTIRELRISAEKVRPGGYIAGHDYCSGNVITPWPYGVIEACHQFCAESRWKYAYITLEYHGHLSFALTQF